MNDLDDVRLKLGEHDVHLSRHDMEIRYLNIGADRQDKALEKQDAEIASISSEINRKLDDMGSVGNKIIGGMFLLLIGIVIDLLVRLSGS